MIVRRVLRMCVLPLLVTLVVFHGQKLLVSAEQPSADDKSGRRAAGSGDVIINEIRIDQPGSDVDEYLELTGEADASLDGLTYIVIGDDSGGDSGVIEAVVDLTGSSIGGSGFFVAAEDSNVPGGGTVDLVTSLNFENSDNVTHMVVFGFTGEGGEDVDTDNDGVIDNPLWSSMVSCIALVETPGSGELIYCDDTVGPDGPFVPGHVYRCHPAGPWTIGQFEPDGGDDTPGAVNTACAPICGDGKCTAGEDCETCPEDCGPCLPGDECEDCLPIETDVPTAGTTTDNTGDVDDTTCTFNDEIDQWYCWTASCDGTATASLCGSGYDTALAVFDACGGDQLACNDDFCGLQSQVSWDILAGTTYNVRVSGYNNSTGDYTLLVTELCVGELPNDNCVDRIDIFDGDTNYDTTGASTDGPVHEECQFDGQTYHDIWYNYTATCTGVLNVSTCNQADYDTDLVVYDGCDCNNLVLLGCNDDFPGCAGFTSKVVVPVAAGNCYKIRVGGWMDGDFGTGTLSITCKGDAACCDHAQPGGQCTDGVSESDCLDDPNLLQPEWFPGLTCAEVEAAGLCEEHTGACCDHSQPGGSCTDDVPESECLPGGSGQTHGGRRKGEPHVAASIDRRRTASALGMHDVPAGLDLFMSPPGAGTVSHAFNSAMGGMPIPADFFAPGSDPFDGPINLEGRPLAGMAVTDTIIERLQDANFPPLDDPSADCPSEATIDIEIVALSLVSSNPITVTFNGGQDPEPWDVYVCLSDLPQPLGSMTIRHECPDGGTFDSFLPILPKLIFTPAGSGPDICFNEVTGDPANRCFDAGLHDLPLDILVGTDVGWVHNPDPAFDVVTVRPGLQVDGNCDGKLETLDVGTGPFVPGINPSPCDCETPRGGSGQLKELTAEQSLLAAHGILPSQDHDIQIEWFKGLTCAEIKCLEHTGACCNGYTGECEDDVRESDCPTGDPQFRWEKDTLCINLDPPCEEHTGACCDGTTGTCVDNTPESACQNANPGVGPGPCSECGPGPGWVGNCPAGTDLMDPTGAVFGLDLDLDGLVDQNVIASGLVTIDRGPGDPASQKIQTEIVSMQLTGGDGIVLRAGSAEGLPPSLGAITDSDGDGEADSFFDVFFEIDTPAGTLHNEVPLHIEDEIDCVPPQAVYIHVITNPIPLLDAAGVHVANLVTARHNTFPDQFRWEKDTFCIDLEPPCEEHTGACCDQGITGECINDVAESECPFERWEKDTFCDELDPQCREGRCNPDCVRDVDGDGQIGAFDLANLLGCWGPIVPGTVCECFDKDGDGQITAFDLASLLGNWGPCPCTEDADCPEGEGCQEGQCVRIAQPGVVITDTFDQDLPSEVETFWQIVFPPAGVGTPGPVVNEIGFKAKVSNLGGLTVTNYEWTIDGPMGALTRLGGINFGRVASFECCGTPFDVMPDNPTVLMGPKACAVEFKSWTGATGLGSKTVKVEVTLSNAAVISAEIEVKVLSYLTETVPGTARGHSLLEEHFGWHKCFDSGDCDADGPDNMPGTPDDNPYWNVGAAADLTDADHKAAYLFLKFHRRFAVAEMAAYRTAAGLGAVPQTPHIPLVFPNPLRDGGGPQVALPEPAQVECPAAGSSDPQHITPCPAPLCPLVGFATSHDLGIGTLGWHADRHSDYCSHGDVPFFTSPRDISLYWFHKMIDDVWTTWLTANAVAPHFYVIVTARDPGPGGSITQADLTNVGILVTLSDAVTGVVKENLTLTDAGGTETEATSVNGNGVGPYVFKFATPPAPGLVTVTLKKGMIIHQDPTDPVNPKRDNPLENDVSWQITVLPNPP